MKKKQVELLGQISLNNDLCGLTVLRDNCKSKVEPDCCYFELQYKRQS